MAHSNDLDFFNRIPVAGLLVNKIGRPNFIYNLKFLSLVGYTDAQMSEIFIRDYTKVFDEEDIKELRRKLKEAEGTKKSVRQELKLTCADSTRLFTVIEAEVSEENDGSYVLCALTDITQIKKAQADYMLEQERLLSVLRNYDDDLFEYDFETDLLKVFNKNVLIKDSFGDDRWIKFENFSKNLSQRRMIHPEDESKLRFVFNQKSNYTIQIRMKYKDEKNYRWYEVDFNLLQDDDNNIIGYVGNVHDIDELKASTIEFKNKSQHDSLTGLYNNASAKEIIEEYLQNEGKGRTNALMIIDLDDFKHVNDTFGHRFGDRVIKTAADTLNNTFGENDLTARIGGDEFLVFCRDILDMSSVNEKVRKVFETFAQNPVGDKEQYVIKTSIGIAVSPQDGTGFKRLFDKADRNMYKVKRSGKNSYNF
ncbi:MAG: sensor domain-containing diguanylate cyclase [Lachnospiraceae bacterium]|nr:sensor domain-containing diguanylate cyclase [Lachnospiraceae bacterium]